ncbi:hypothetical protein BDN72DRAFT_780167 [Pluteus cervinus]|uniref:Uncharacterized protein n=1 Tax=Pluteus cervinus TaxID=181527 RepID=A0ACD3A1W2_9AGAR|nr:hypothetical protein BDN72DRAFT_780167 [Pluteus cervinus]
MDPLNLRVRILALEEAVFKLSRDYTARLDFAFRFAGGKVIDKLTTLILYNSPSTRVNPPVVALNDDIRVGNCWPTHPSSQLGISLAARVQVSHITVDHIAKELVPSTKQAPREVIVWGVIDSMNSQYLHELENNLTETIASLPRPNPLITGNRHLLPIAFLSYNISSFDDIQTFPIFDSVSKTPIVFSEIIADLVNNWGHETTCLYRV